MKRDNPVSSVRMAQTACRVIVEKGVSVASKVSRDSTEKTRLMLRRNSSSKHSLPTRFFSRKQSRSISKRILFEMARMARKASAVLTASTGKTAETEKTD